MSHEPLTRSPPHSNAVLADTPHHGGACAAWSAGYEALRAQMIGSAATTPVRGVGLVLLLEQGVAAWLHAVGSSVTLSALSRRPSAPAVASQDHDASLSRGSGPRADLIPAGQHDEIATLLAGLVLSAFPMCAAQRASAISPGASS